MALRVTEFFGFAPGDSAAEQYVARRRCPFVKGACIKPDHGACSVKQVLQAEPVICCPNRMYGDNYKILAEISTEAFGLGVELVRPAEVAARTVAGSMTGNEVVVFGRYWGQELPLPRPLGTASTASQYYVDWILAKLDGDGALAEMTAVEVQTVDTTGNYSDQAQSFFEGAGVCGRTGPDPRL